MYKGTCKNCGYDEGLHHYETMQCPVGGEVQIGRKQEWMRSTFLEDKPDEIAELKAQVKKLEAQVKALLDAVPSAKVNA